MKETYKMDFAAPNLVNVCVDRRGEGGYEGRLYCGYYSQPVKFYGEYGMVKIMEELMDSINYPQASTVMRRYSRNSRKKTLKKCENKRILSDREVMRERGKLATFAIYVQYRQSSTWQGEFFWVEKGQVQRFKSMLELLKFVDRILEYGQTGLPECRTTNYFYREHKEEEGEGV